MYTQYSILPLAPLIFEKVKFTISTSKLPMNFTIPDNTFKWRFLFFITPPFSTSPFSTSNCGFTSSKICPFSSVISSILLNIVFKIKKLNNNQIR